MVVTEWPLSTQHIFGLCIILSCISSKTYWILAHTCISNCWARSRCQRKRYTLIGGQRAEKFENHCFLHFIDHF